MTKSAQLESRRLERRAGALLVLGGQPIAICYDGQQTARSGHSASRPLPKIIALEDRWLQMAALNGGLANLEPAVYLRLIGLEFAAEQGCQGALLRADLEAIHIQDEP
jgi:hypothetical protein